MCLKGASCVWVKHTVSSIVKVKSRVKEYDRSGFGKERYTALFQDAKSVRGMRRGLSDHILYYANSGY